MVTKCLSVVLALLFLSFDCAAADVDVQVEPDPPAAGESFRIAFVAQGEIDGEPDFATLETVVDILSRNRQTSIQWINGKHTRTTSWVLEVMPKQAGKLVIPALTFGASESAPRTVAIAGTAGVPTDDGLLLEVEATPQNPYVQQQVTYIIRLWRRFELSNGTLSEPRLGTDALVRPLGEDKHFDAEKNGKRYEVIERRFALFPQKSGATEIKPVTVTAQVLARGLSLFDMFGQSVKTKRLSSAAIPLTVRPVPASFPAGAAWLPARRVRLNETWEPATLAAAVGEPMTRTLTLWAEGLTPGQLPTLKFTPPAGLKLYPDQPKLTEEQHDGLVTAVHQEKIALIAEQPGEVSVPAVEVPWWNLDTGQVEIAKVPAAVLSARAAPATSSAASAPTQSTVSPEPAPKILPLVTSINPTDGVSHRWQWVAIGALCGWLLTGIWALRVWRRGKATPSARADVAIARAESLGATTARVTKACHANDPRAAREALLTWAAQCWPETPTTGLGALADAVPEISAQIQVLNAALYGTAQAPWVGAPLAEGFARALKRAAVRVPGPAPALPILFKVTQAATATNANALFD
ncbi:MAG: protein BatD [Gammaproteobacteria bacterium]|nr:protein BatD [Gammaproteobacteria bacterium]